MAAAVLAGATHFIGLRDGRFDLTLIGVGGASPAGLTTRVLLDEPLVAAVRRDDPLATARTVTLRGLQDRPLISVALLPASLAAEHEAELHAVTITEPALRARIELAWRPDGPASPAARALIRLAQGGQPAGRG